MDIAAVVLGGHPSAPPIRPELVLAHCSGEADAEIAAALIGEREVEVAPRRISLRRRADQLADDIDRKPRLRRHQQPEVAKVGDLDPPLSLPPQVDAERVEDRAEPCRHDERRLRDQRPDLVGNARRLGRRL
jgi:hypothetical protein